MAGSDGRGDRVQNAGRAASETGGANQCASPRGASTRSPKLTNSQASVCSIKARASRLFNCSAGFFSPASIAKGSRFWAGGSGQTANDVNPHGGV